MELPENPIVHQLLEQSRRQDQQVAILDKAVEGYIVKDIPVPPWFSRGSGDGCQGCGAVPTHEVLAHSLGGCDNADVDDEGNFVWQGCTTCYEAWRQELVTILHRLHNYLPVPCPTCQRPISQVSDIMLRERVLR